MNEINNRHVASILQPAINGAYQGWMPCIDWCEQQIVDGWWYIGKGVFEFVDERDHLMFMLRWG